jgi:glycyl-tRNA synthetase
MRAETCQGIFVNFKNVLDSSRVKIPFGIAQIGKSFRNEITPGNFIFRMREFEQMEMEFFCNPNDKNKSPNDWFEEWKEKRLNWYLNLGMKAENLRLVEVAKEDRSHYAQRQIDLEYHFPFGWKEIEGIHNRGDWDLSNHSKFSGQDLQVLSEETKEKYFPHVIETSVGVERSMLAFLCEAYEEVEGGRSTTTQAVKEVEINLNLPKRLAPITVAVLPLVKNKEEITNKAREVDAILRKYFTVQYDETGTIGKRYRRQDEIGTPYCVTIDFESLTDQAVTVRDRATMSQERVSITDLASYLTKKLEQ